MQPKKKKRREGHEKQIQSSESLPAAASGKNGEDNTKRKVSSLVVENRIQKVIGSLNLFEFQCS
jgi:hypothetical protein